MKKIAFLVSGSGTNMQNLVEKIQQGKVAAKATLVVCDVPGAAALEKAKRLGVETIVVDRKAYADKASFEAEIIKHLDAKKIDLIALAGFMRILSADFVKRYKGRLINIHPSYLPTFPGAHAIQDAFEAKVKETGVTVHFVDEGVDSGPIILQRKVTVDPSDTLQTLEKKVHAVEYKLYPEALNLVLSGKAHL